MKILTTYTDGLNKAWFDVSDRNTIVLSLEHDGVEFQIEFEPEDARLFREELEPLIEFCINERREVK